MTTQVVALPAPVAELASQIELARQAAIEVFGNCVGVELMDNPECNGESWHVFTVRDVVTGDDYRAVVQRRLRWHDRVRELIPAAMPEERPDFRLSIVLEP
jgi:hypothetical protein